MHWLIQSCFDHDPKVRELINHLERMKINHSFCKAVPFSENDLVIDFDLNDIDEPIFTYGSYTLSKIISKRGYKPGAFISPDISLDRLLSNYGDKMFNDDMKFYRLGDVADHVSGEFFIRPMEDSKSFPAEVMGKDTLVEYINDIKGIGDGWSPVTLDTMVAVCKPKEIQQEIRFFVVDGKISTYSSYKVGDRVQYSEDVDRNIIDYVSSLVGFGNWNPDIAYCLDIAVSDWEPKVLEVNSINSSGLYAIDTQKLIMSIEGLNYKYRS